MTSSSCQRVPFVVVATLLASACSTPSAGTADTGPGEAPDSGPGSPSCVDGETITCCDDVVARGTAMLDPSTPPFTSDTAADLVDETVVAEGEIDATWVEARAGTGAYPTEMVLDRDGEELVIGLASALADVPAIEAGTRVHVAPPSDTLAGVWITDAEGATIGLVSERGHGLRAGPFDVGTRPSSECLVPTYVWAGGTGWCWIGAFRYDAEVGGAVVRAGGTTSIVWAGAEYDVTLHRLQLQDGFVTSSSQVGCAPRVQDEISLEAWRVD